MGFATDKATSGQFSACHCVLLAERQQLALLLAIIMLIICALVPAVCVEYQFRIFTSSGVYGVELTNRIKGPQQREMLGTNSLCLGVDCSVLLTSNEQTNRFTNSLGVC